MLTEGDALRIARDHAHGKRLPWPDGMIAFLQDDFMWDDKMRPAWAVIDNTGCMGGNLQIAVDAESGEVLECVFHRR
jgi:hypothetical protein